MQAIVTLHALAFFRQKPPPPPPPPPGLVKVLVKFLLSALVRTALFLAYQRGRRGDGGRANYAWPGWLIAVLNHAILELWPTLRRVVNVALLHGA